MSGDGLGQRIIDRAKAEGAALVGIVRVADLKKGPSYATYDTAPFYPEYKGVEWKDEYSSVLVWALPHPPSEPALDWWSLKVKGFTPGNRELAAQSKRLRVWVNEELGLGALSAPYQIEYGGVFLKDAAVMAGLGVIGRNNILVTPRYGPRIRLRALFVGAQLESTPALTDFDPCSSCNAPCHRACPRDAFGSGRFRRSLCKQEQDQRDVDFEVMDGAVMGVDEASNVTAYCRACELACPVATKHEVAGASRKATGTVGARATKAARAAAEAAGESTHFVLAEDTWAAFVERLDGKSEPLSGLSDAAAKADPLGDGGLRLAPLTESDDVASFACGDAALDQHLATNAYAERTAGQTHVAARGSRVVAYFGLKAATVSPPPTIAQQPGEAPLDVPAILLRRLAVDGTEQGHGLGEAMLVQALARCLQAADTMFARAVLVDAGDTEARGFFEKYGFAPSPTAPGHLVMRMKDIRKSLAPPQE